jgi:predicted PurR-regulated permease PerM
MRADGRESDAKCRGTAVVEQPSWNSRRLYILDTMKRPQYGSRPDRGMQLVRPFLLVLLVGFLALSFVLLRSFLSPIILAILLATLTHPVYRWLLKRLGNRRSLTALIMVLSATIVIAVPVFMFLYLLLSQGVEFVRAGIQWIEAGKFGEMLDLPVFSKIENWYIGLFGESLSIRQQIVSLTESIAKGFVNSGLRLFGDAVNLVSGISIFVFMLFFLFRDGKGMADALRDLLPMRRAQTDRVFKQINNVTQAVLLGTFLVSCIQGVLGGIGLMIVGIPGLVWGTAIGFSSMIPMVGTFLITIPVTAYLFLTGAYWQGAFFAVWAFAVVGGIDNILRPLFMHGRAQMSPFFVFLGVFGGISYFGVSGLVYGPLIIALTMVVINIYRTEFSGVLRSNRR